MYYHKILTPLYLILGSYFGIVFGWGILSFHVSIYYPEDFFSITMWIVFIIMFFFLLLCRWGIPHKYINNPLHLKSLTHTELLFYLYSSTLVILYSFSVSPTGEIGGILALSLFFFGGSMRFNSYYIGEQVSKSLITTKYFLKLNCLYFFTWLFIFTTGIYLFSVNYDNNSGHLPLSLILILMGVPIIITRENGIVGYVKGLNSETNPLLRDFRYLQILTKFDVFIVIPALLTSIFILLLYWPSSFLGIFFNCMLLLFVCWELYDKKRKEKKIFKENN